METILQYIDNEASPEEKMNILLFVLKYLTRASESNNTPSIDQEVNDQQHVNNHHHHHVHVNSSIHVHSPPSFDVKNASTSLMTLHAQQQVLSTFKKVSSSSSDDIKNTSTSFITFKKPPCDCKYKLNICNGQHDIIITQHVSTFLKDPFIVDTLDTMANKCAIRKIKRKRGRPRKNFCK